MILVFVAVALAASLFPKIGTEEVGAGVAVGKGVEQVSFSHPHPQLMVPTQTELAFLKFTLMLPQLQ